MEIKVLLGENAKMPEKAHPDSDAGFDLFAPSDFIVPPTIVNQSGMVTIDTNICMQIPNGYCGLIVSKSGLNVKHNLTATGLVDALYNGHIKVKLYNHGDTEYRISKGDKVAQIMILPVPEVNLIEVDGLEETERGTGGFGSTGK